eukprot:scaffold318530_cov39-Prasinocladus_malaysianus.AAC.1
MVGLPKLTVGSAGSRCEWLVFFELVWARGVRRDLRLGVVGVDRSLLWADCERGLRSVQQSRRPIQQT